MSRSPLPLTATIAAGAAAVLIATAGGVAGATITAEDEDAFVQLTPAAGRTSGWGTAWANQVIETNSPGKRVSNQTTGWMTVYGLSAKKKYIVTIRKGACGSRSASVSSRRHIRTDGLGGWHGKYTLDIKSGTKWVVRGGYRLDVAKKGGQIHACGAVQDDPDIGN